jgi:hypothetical protein
MPPSRDYQIRAGITPEVTQTYAQRVGYYIPGPVGRYESNDPAHAYSWVGLLGTSEIVLQQIGFPRTRCTAHIEERETEPHNER